MSAHAARPAAETNSAVRTAFLGGLSEITKDKQIQNRFAKRFDDFVENGGDATHIAGSFYMEAAARFGNPDKKYYAAMAKYEEGLPAALRRPSKDAKWHPGQRQVPPSAFISEYNTDKIRTHGRLSTAEDQIKGADALLRVLAAKEIANATTRQEVIDLRRQFDEVSRGYARAEASPDDDPAVKQAKKEKRDKLDERFKAVYKAAEELVEQVDRDVAVHARAIDDLNLQSGDHRVRIDNVETELGQHRTMLTEQNRVVTKIARDYDRPGSIAFIALLVGLGVGFVAFLIKLFIVVPDRVTRETIRGVTVEHVTPSALNGFWPSFVVGIIAFGIALVITFCIGVYLADRQMEAERMDVADDNTSPMTAFEQTLHNKTTRESDAAEPAEPDHLDRLDESMTPVDDTRPVPSRA